MCRRLEPGDCIKISIVLPDGTQFTYPFVRKSPKLKELLKARDGDFEKVMLIKVQGNGGKVQVVVVLSPDTTQIRNFAKTLYRGTLELLERVKMEMNARNLPHM